LSIRGYSIIGLIPYVLYEKDPKKVKKIGKKIMWKQILANVNAAILRNWSSLVWFVLGAVLGAFFLGGMVSCTAVTSIEEGVSNVDDTIRDVPVLGRVYALPSDVVSGVYNLGKDGVETVVDVVTPDGEEE